MAGLCRTIREESHPKNREFMLDYVINLLDDATDFSWASKRPAMRFFYVAWNRVKYRADLKLIRLTEYAEPTHRDILQARAP